MNNRAIRYTLLAGALTLVFTACATEMNTGNGTHASDACPSDIKGNECEYHKDGYWAGAGDGKMGMSMVYQRHEGYDSRFEPYFARGYEAGWRVNR
ncbi:MAG: hypothetical protein WBG92_01660 [Thiohalocapsa sp.]